MEDSSRRRMKAASQSTAFMRQRSSRTGRINAAFDFLRLFLYFEMASRQSALIRRSSSWCRPSLSRSSWRRLLRSVSKLWVSVWLFGWLLCCGFLALSSASFSCSRANASSGLVIRFDCRGVVGVVKGPPGVRAAARAAWRYATARANLSCVLLLPQRHRRIN